MRAAPRVALFQRAALGALAREVVLWLALAALVLLGAGWAYRQPLRYDLPIAQADGLEHSGLGEVEFTAEGRPFRWTASTMQVRVPGVGRAPTVLRLEVHHQPSGVEQQLSVGSGAALVSQLLRPYWQRLVVVLPPAAVDAVSGDLVLTLQVDPPLPAAQHDYGVALGALGLRQTASASLPPAVGQALLVLLALIYPAARLLGIARRWLGLGLAALGIALALLLARWRVDVLQALPAARQALLLAWLAVPPLAWWVRRQAVGTRPWAAAVAATALLLGVLHYGGLRHPRFEAIDHVLRVHQIVAIAQGRRAEVQTQLSRQYEWGDNALVPYALLSYDLFVPLASWLDHETLRQVVEAVTAAAAASVVPLLWSIARRSGYSVAQSGWSALLVACFPVVHLYQHDGSFPTIIGLTAAVLALWLLLRLAQQARWWWWLLSGAAIAVSMLLYVTHLLFVPLLVGLIAVAALLVGTPEQRSGAWRMLGALALGVGGAMLAYYGAYLPELLFHTIPRYLLTLRAQGSVGRDAALLPGPLLGGPLEQLWGHYRLIGAVLAALGAALALRRPARWWAPLVLGYAGFVALTMLVDLRFGLWNKHLYFALPGVALGAGGVLGALYERGTAGRLTTVSLVAWLAWASLTAWGLRVLHYVWSLQTL
ncbi:glycosyltransferase family 39 protein [Kallotenue papyrolyticum]|uniref:glycosyltransferase family 39 protein n=1 Tax=Kallotenue papyrolyticum TaxID=1325125 RepID=UPI0004785DE6|nr:glycosyltransferase family 39 protein [Kallotenue papyrolyticum]